MTIKLGEAATMFLPFFQQGDEEASAQLGLANLGGVFIVLMGGMITSCIIAVVEYLWGKRMLIHDENVSDEMQSKVRATLLKHRIYLYSKKTFGTPCGTTSSSHATSARATRSPWRTNRSPSRARKVCSTKSPTTERSAELEARKRGPAEERRAAGTIDVKFSNLQNVTRSFFNEQKRRGEQRRQRVRRLQRLLQPKVQVKGIIHPSMTNRPNANTPRGCRSIRRLSPFLSPPLRVASAQVFFYYRTYILSCTRRTILAYVPTTT